MSFMDLKHQRVAIVGGGVGGLALANRLQQSGSKVTIYEASPEMKHLGGGLILAPNSVNALERLGLGSVAKVHAAALDRMIIFDQNGRELYRREQSEVAHRYHGHGLMGIARHELHRSLSESLPPEVFRFGHKLVEMDNHFDGVDLRFANRQRVNAEIAIGADGRNSRMREILFPEAELRPTGDVAYRGVCKNVPYGPLANSFVEYWGAGRRFSFFKMSQNEVYWHAAIQQAEFGAHLDRSELMELLQEFPAQVCSLIGHTPPDQISRLPLTDTGPLKSWWTRRAVLIGDAAHATSPNLGQGAAQALEDALALADSLRAQPDLVGAMRGYQAMREGTANAAVRNARTFGEIGRKAGLGRLIRNVAMNINPDLARRRIEAFYGEHHH